MLEQQEKPFAGVRNGGNCSGRCQFDLSQRFECEFDIFVKAEAGRKETHNKTFSFLVLTFVRFLSRFQVDDNDLWVLSNRMIRHSYSKVDVDNFNFRIFRSPVAEVVKGTKCESGRVRSRKRIVRRRGSKV